MLGSIIFPLTILLVDIIYETNGQSKALITSHVVFRHGDRTPVTTFPTDPVNATDWPNGFGQLTIAGIEQQHRLGAYFRSRFANLLSVNYTPREIVVRSTDVDRTLMSAQSNLVGLYPVTNITNGNVPIQPIPIHTEPVNMDFLLGVSTCPRYDQLEDDFNQSDEVKKMNEYYADFFKKLESWTNMTNITVYNAWEIADTIFVEHIYNKTPAWADEGVRKNLSEINDLAFHYLYANNDTKRIRGGPLIQDVWSNINNTIHGKAAPKVKIYSAHDTTVSAVLAFLGINYPHQPQYASALFIDLYKDNATYYVKVEYLNVTDSNVTFAYVLDGCPENDCPFDTFTSIYQPRFPDSADKECKKKEPPMPDDNNNGKLLPILIVVIVALIILIFVIFFYLHLRNKKRDTLLLGDNSSVQTA